MEEQGSIVQSERIFAALIHGSILIYVALVVVFVASIRGGTSNAIGVGLVGCPGVALLTWLVQRGKSGYVAAQALQAFVYQLAVLVVTPVLAIVWLFLLVAGGGIDLGDPPAWVLPTLIALPVGVLGASVLHALLGAVRCLGGHDFRYALIGKWVGRRG